MSLIDVYVMTTILLGLALAARVLGAGGIGQGGKRRMILDDAPMTTAEFRAALVELGKTQSATAELLGVSARTARNYAIGASIPPWAARHLRLWLEIKRGHKIDVPA